MERRRGQAPVLLTNTMSHQVHIVCADCEEVFCTVCVHNNAVDVTISDGVPAKAAVCPRCGGDFAVRERSRDLFGSGDDQLPLATRTLIERLGSLELEEMNPEELRTYTTANHDVIGSGLSAALRAGMSSLRPEMLLSVVEALPILHWRALALRRQRRQVTVRPDESRLLETPNLLGPDLVAHIRAMGRVAVCSFHADDSGVIWALVVQNLGADRELGFAQVQVVPKEEGADYAQKLAAYTRTLGRDNIDFALQRELMRPFGNALLSLFSRVERPDELVLIPHGRMSALPLHAASITAGDREIALPELIRSIVYASSLSDFVFGGLLTRYSRGDDKNATIKALVLSADGSACSGWGQLELEHYKVLREIGWTVDITKTPSPNPLAGYDAIFTDWEASSDLFSWNETHLDNGARRVTATEIMADWRLDHSIVTLSKAHSVCSDIRDTGEYCGLDLAMRLAGASCVFSGLWRMSDPLAVLTASTLFDWVRTYRVPPGEALVRFQRGLRVGDWHRWMLTEEQLMGLPGEIKDRLRSRRDAFLSLPPNSFAEWQSWASVRCFGRGH
jgi:hypothetical protein